MNLSVVLKLRGRPLSPNQNEKFRRKKALSILLTVTIIFFAAWAPLNIFTLLSEYHPNFLNEALKHPNHDIICGLMLLMGGTNSVANPILYGYMNENFKKEYKKFYEKMFCKPKFGKMKNERSLFSRTAFYKKSSCGSQNDEILLRTLPPKLLKNFSDSTLLMKPPVSNSNQLQDVQKCKLNDNTISRSK